VPNPDQPRRHFDVEALQELSQSIARRGILQPLIVRPSPRGEGLYEIVAGERRWRAAQMANLHEVPVAIRSFDDGEVLEVAIIENIQRSDLNALEEAQGFRHLMDRFGHTQDQVAEILGKSRSHVANLLRLLKLPDGVQKMLQDGDLSAGHARAVITSDDPLRLARTAISKGLSVRETEALARGDAKPRRQRKETAPVQDADTRALEGDLSASLGLRVSIQHAKAGEGGHLSITYRSLEDLDLLCGLLSQGFERD
jgi:ParB family chromosome partitioning protein